MSHKEFFIKIDKALTPTLDGTLTGREKMAKVVAIGNKHLESSALIYNPELTEAEHPELIEKDYQDFLQFFIEVHPPNKETYWLHGHESTVAEFAARLGEAYGLNPWRMRILALMHDFGRIFSHDADIHEKMGDYVLNEMKIRPGLTGSLHSVNDAIEAVKRSEKSGIPIKEIVQYQVDTDPLEKKLLTIADMAGKRDKDTWKIMTFEESLQRHKNTADALRIAPKPNSQLDHRHYDADTDRYLMIKEMLEKDNIDIEQMRKDILESERIASIHTIVTDETNPNAKIAAKFAKAQYNLKTAELSPETISRMQIDFSDHRAGYVIAMAQGHVSPTTILLVGNTNDELNKSGIKTLRVNDNTTYSDIIAGFATNGLPLDSVTHL